MAHECPECGAMCYCRGDCDDVLLNDEDAINRCEHWQKPECDGYNYDDDYHYEDVED